MVNNSLFRRGFSRARRLFAAVPFPFRNASRVRSLSAAVTLLLRRMLGVHAAIPKLPLLFALPGLIEDEAARLGISPKCCMALWRFHLELVNE